MSSKQTNLLQGTLDLLILKALGTGNSTDWAFHAASSKSLTGHFWSSRVRCFRLFIAWKKRVG